MKNKYQQSLIQSAKKYKPYGRLNADGISIDHLYEGLRPLSWSDDFGFWLGSQWVSVYWQHPRSIYLDEISRLAYEQAGDYPEGHFFDGSTPNYIKVGRSRKKIVAWTTREINREHAEYYDRLQQIENQLCADGIDFDVLPSIKVFQRRWGRSVMLCSSESILNEDDVTRVAIETREMMRQAQKAGSTTMLQILQQKQTKAYGRNDWLVDWPIEQASREERRHANG